MNQNPFALNALPQNYSPCGAFYHDNHFKQVAIESFRKIYLVEPSVIELTFHRQDVRPYLSSDSVVTKILGIEPGLSIARADVHTYDTIGFTSIINKDATDADIECVDPVEEISNVPTPSDAHVISFDNRYLYYVEDMEAVVLIDNDTCLSVYYRYTKINEDKIKEFVEKFRNEALIPCANKTFVWCVGVSNSHYYLMPMEILPHDGFDIDRLYNDDLKKVDEDIHEFLLNKRSGLVILHGKPGTGKTSYIRQLAKNSKTIKFVYLPYALVDSLSSPEFVSFMQEEMKNSVLIVEDCEQLLVRRSNAGSSSGIVNLLNIADGMFGDTIRMKIICTFNDDISSIGMDSALLRKGRLTKKYEFKELCSEKTKVLLKELGKEVDEDQKPLPLSDIFYKDEENDPQDKTEDKDMPVYF